MATRYTKHPIRDEPILMNSRSSHLKSTRVIPASFWTSTHRSLFDDLHTISREQSHGKYGHSHIHGTLEGVPTIVQEWLGSKAEVLPFPTSAWLFHKNTPGYALVVLRGDFSVPVKTLRQYVQSTPEFHTWSLNTTISPPFIPFPTPNKVKEFLMK